MRALFIFVSACLALDLDKFVGKEIRIFFSNANHVFLGLDTRSSRLTARSKYYDLDGFATVARLIPDSSYFRLRFRSEPICAEGDVVKKCDIGTNWTVRSKVFGYLISDGSKCVTLAERSLIKMMPCTESEDQVVDFKLKSEDQDCGQDGELDGHSPEPKNPDPHREIIVINVPNKQPVVEHTQVLQPVHLARPAAVPIKHIVASDEPTVRILPTITEKHDLIAAPPRTSKLEIATDSDAPSRTYTDDGNSGFLDFVHAQLVT